MYFFAKLINAEAAVEKRCSFFHISAVELSSAGENGMNLSPS